MVTPWPTKTHAGAGTLHYWFGLPSSQLWGNSLAIRLPRSVVEVLGLKEGDNIEIHIADRRSFAIEKAPTSKQLLERLRKYRGRLPVGFRFDRLEANERG